MTNPPLFSPSASLLSFILFLFFTLLVRVLRIIDNILSEHQPGNMQQTHSLEFDMKVFGLINLIQIDPDLFTDWGHTTIHKNFAFVREIVNLFVWINE
jgi:hypothetical protein